jgi:hypothetical protein
MKFNNLNIRQFIFAALIHGATSAAVILSNWDSIERRLSRETISLLTLYTIASLLLLIVILFLKKNNYVIAWMTLLPYLAISIAYILVLYLWITNRSTKAQPLEVFPVVMITLSFPYLVIWGPIISVINLLAMYLLKKIKKK